MIVLITVFLLIAVLQGRKLIKNNRIKELLVFEILLLIGFIMSILKTLNILIPDPTEAIKKIIDNINGFF